MCSSKYKVLMINKLVFARIVSLSLFAFLFVGGMQCAAADESRFNFAHDQASVVLASGVTAEASSGLPPDSEIINVLRGGRRILGIYAGNQPDNSVTKNNPPSKETIAGFTALTYRVSSKKGRSRQTFVQVKDEGWPNVIHFFLPGLPTTKRILPTR